MVLRQIYSFLLPPLLRLHLILFYGFITCQLALDRLAFLEEHYNRTREARAYTRPTDRSGAAQHDTADTLHSSAKPDDQQPKGSRIRRSGRDKKWHDDLVDKVMLDGDLNVREDGTKFYFKIVDKVPCTVHVERDPGTDDDVFVLTRGGLWVVYDDPSKQKNTPILKLLWDPTVSNWRITLEFIWNGRGFARVGESFLVMTLDAWLHEG